MPEQKRGLGRGRGALTPTAQVGEPAAAFSDSRPDDRYPSRRARLAEMAGAFFDEIPLESITPNPRQPRQIFDDEALAELAESIEVVGLLQPIVVRRAGEGRYEIVMGERRWRACQMADLSAIPGLGRGTPDDDLLRDAPIGDLPRP